MRSVVFFRRLSAAGFRGFSTITGGDYTWGTGSRWPPVSIVGAGQLGSAVAANLLRNNVNVTMFDIHGDANVPEELKQHLTGVRWASSAAEAAGSTDVVITALPKPEHVSQAFEGPDGILQTLKRGSVWIEHSTTDFENTAKVAAAVNERGAHCVEAPLTGGMQLLRAGKMVALVGAKPEVLEGNVAKLIALSAPRIVRCGEFGHATVIKVQSNILCAVMDAAMGESLCVAKAAGVDMKLMFDAIRVSSGNSFCWETEAPRALRGDYFPDFTAVMMKKDIDLGLDLARKLDVPNPVIQHVSDIYQECITKFGAECGSTSPVRLAELNAQVKLSEGPGSAAHAMQDWTYTAEIENGSYRIDHKNMDNPFLKEPFTLHSPDPDKQ